MDDKGTPRSDGANARYASDSELFKEPLVFHFEARVFSRNPAEPLYEFFDLKATELVDGLARRSVCECGFL